MKGKLIIFDFDGVVVDSWAHSYGRNVREWPHLQPHEHRAFFNGNIHEEIAKMPPSVMTPEETTKYIEEVWNPAKMDLPVFEGIFEVLKKLSEDNTLVINTSAPEGTTKEYLEKAGLEHFFERIYGVEISKDKVQKFKQILEDYKASPEDCLFITDTVGDVLEAKVCSIKSLAVTYGYQSREYFDPVESEVIGFADIPADILKLYSL